MNINEAINYSIKNFLSENNFKKKFPEEYEYIIDHTFDCDTFTERKYKIYNNIKETPICPICGKKSKFHNFTIGYGKYSCSKKCAHIIATKTNQGNLNNLSKEEKRNKYWLSGEETRIKNNYKSPFNNKNIMDKIDFKEVCKNSQIKLKELRKDKNWYNNWHNKIAESNKSIEKINKIKNTRKLWSDEYKKEVYEKASLSYYKTKLGNLYNDFIDDIKFKEKCKELKYNIINISKYYNVSYACILSKFHKLGLKDKIRNLSSYENYIEKWLKEHNIKYIKHDRTIIKPLELDFYLPDYNIAIEFNGNWAHSEIQGKDKNYHINKYKSCLLKNIRLISIWEWEYLNNSTKLLNWLESLLNDNKVKIFARKCIIKELDKSTYNNFVNLYHLQGSTKDKSINIGLYYNNELVEVMSFTKSRYNKNYEYELLRLCSKYNHLIIGGANKLLKYFIDNYKPNSIISYCDNNKFNGNIYEKLGFKYNNTTIGKHWVLGNIHISNNLLLKYGADKLIGTNKGKGSNNELVLLENNYLPYYDCGQSSYIMLF